MAYTNLIKGTDGVAPVFDTDIRWKLRSYDEIYLGQAGLNKLIPKINDGVVDWLTQKYYVVTGIDDLSCIPVLKEVKRSQYSEFERHEILLGSNDIIDKLCRRIYINTSVFPYTLNVDTRIAVAGTNSHSAMLFRGTDISSTGEILSQVYNNSGELVSNKVELKLTVVENMTNYTLKHVPEFHTNKPLLNNELVTLVIYNITGGVEYKRTWLIEQTDYVRRPENNISYVQGISLESPFIDPTEPDLVRIPLNLPMSSMNFMGVIHYNDKVIRRPIDNTTFKLYGLNNLLSSIPGAITDNLILSYNLSQYETASSETTTDGLAITRKYRIITDEPNNSYSVKLMAIPHWLGDNQGYGLDWWLLNLDRDLCINVTPYISYESSYGSYSPLTYGVVQRRLVSLPISMVIPNALPYRHSQLIEITLVQPANGITNNWRIDNDVNDSTGAMGENLTIKKLGSNTINFQDQVKQEWLDKSYYKSKPINLLELSNISPTPSHIDITVGSETIRRDITNWPLEDMVFDLPILTSTTAIVKFIKLIGNKTQYLSVVGFTIVN